MRLSTPPRPVQHAEHALITAILEGEFPPGTTLPGERELAAQLGVTRPTLREVVRRLECDGWLTVQQGKSTLVNHFWWDGGLNVLSGIVRYSRHLPPDFVPNLLQVRLDMAPSYARLAVQRQPAAVVELLTGYPQPEHDPGIFAAFDWRVHRGLTVHSGNPVYALILNTFSGFYEQLARGYFVPPDARALSSGYYATMVKAARLGDGTLAEEVTRSVMAESIRLWHLANGGHTTDEGGV